MDDHDWDINLFEIVPQIGLGEHVDTIIRILETTHHTLLPPSPDQPLADLGTFAVEAEERSGGNIEEELRTVCFHRVSEAIEDALGCAQRVGVRFEHQWWDSTNDDGLASTGGSVATEEANDFTSAGGVTDHAGILDVKVLEQSEEVIAVGVCWSH